MNDYVTDWISSLFKAISHPLRLEIVTYLADGEKCVLDIMKALDSEASNTSQHLTVLRNAGVLVRRKQGTFYYYSIKQPECIEIIKTAQRMVERQIGEVSQALNR